MLLGLLSIVVCYGFAVAWVHLVYGQLHRKSVHTIHYVILTKNNQDVIEWWIRSLFIWSWWKGNRINICVFDHYSEDDTVKIMSRLMHHHCLDVKERQSPQDSEDYLFSLGDADVTVIRLDPGESVVHPLFLRG